MSLNIYDKTLGRLKNVAGGGSAHIIINKLGNALTQRHGLKFTGNATITDDSTNDQTIVNIEDSGHTIKDSSGTSMTQRANLQFTGGATVTDDSENGATKIAVPTIIDHLRSDSSTSTLSAKQGGVIANDMASIVLSGDTHSAKIDEGVFFVDKNGILRVAGTGGITAGTNVETNSTVKPIGDVLRELNSNINNMTPLTSHAAGVGGYSNDANSFERGSMVFCYGTTSHVPSEATGWVIFTFGAVDNSKRQIAVDANGQLKSRALSNNTWTNWL